jgi:hypothetical protein
MLANRFYRYRPLGFHVQKCPTCDTEVAPSERESQEKTVFEGKLYFPSRRQFNDPFDCIAPTLTHISRVDLDAFLERRGMEEFTDLSMEERLKKVRSFQNTPPEELERFTEELSDSLGILSLTTKRDNILMWSHYANSHQGFCLEFDFSQIPSIQPRPVVYQRERAQYDISAVHRDANVRNLLLTKYEDWQYEREWRVITERGGTMYEFPCDALTGVILGCRMSESDKQKLQNWIEQSPSRPRLYQARLSGRYFNLEIEPC